MKKKRLCSLLIALAAYVLCVLLFGLSWLAISHVQREWTAVDYWLVWFSVASFLAGAVNFLFGTVWAMTCVDGLCDPAPN